MKKERSEETVSITIKVPPSLKKEWEDYTKSLGSNPSMHLRMYMIKILQEEKELHRADELGLFKK